MEGRGFDDVIVGGSADWTRAHARGETRCLRAHLACWDAGLDDSHSFIHMPMEILWMVRSNVLNGDGWRWWTRSACAMFMRERATDTALQA